MILSIATLQVGNDITVIELSGRVTLGRESGQIEAYVLKSLSEGDKKLIIDMTNVSFIDSTGIGVIAYSFGKISQSGAQARIVGAHGIVKDVFKLTHLDQVLKFADTVDDAVASMKSPS